MKFDVIKTSDSFDKYKNAHEIELNSLEELMNWVKKINNDVIINVDTETLEIYDDWRE